MTNIVSVLAGFRLALTLSEWHPVSLAIQMRSTARKAYKVLHARLLHTFNLLIDASEVLTTIGNRVNHERHRASSPMLHLSNEP